MAVNVVLPLLGQTMEEGTITKWLKQEGDSVEKGEVIFEVMTDKANMEVESPESGILRKIVVPEGGTAPVQSVVAILGTADEPIDAAPAATPAPQASAEPSAPAPSAEIPSSPVVESMSISTGRVFASPRARKAAEERGIDLAVLSGRGTGPGGRIVEKDVIDYAARAASAPPAQQPKITPLAGKVAADAGVDLASLIGSGPGGKIMRDDVLKSIPSRPTGSRGIGRSIPFTGMRKSVADNVSQSVRTAPQVTYVTDVDMTAALEMRSQISPILHKRYGIKPSVTAMVVKAVALAILDYPIVNSTLTGSEIIIHDDINVCVAVSLDNGLVTPVIRDTDRKQLHEIAQEIKLLADKARAGQLKREDLQGGTFTVSSLTSTVVDAFNPIINMPQSAIVGVCRVVEKPVVLRGEIKVRSMMNVSLVWDHRVMDGAPAAQYLGRVKDLLESPYTLLL